MNNFHNLTQQIRKLLFTAYNELHLNKIAEIAEYRYNIIEDEYNEGD